MYDIFGWVGVSTFVVNTFMINFGYVKGNSQQALYTGIIAACLLLLMNFSKNATQNIVVNFILILITALALFKKSQKSN
jgi:hypothetical protein